MARLRLLLSLLMLTAGALLGGLAISGYFEPRTPVGATLHQTQATVTGTPIPPAKPPDAALQGRERFVVKDADPRGSQPAAKAKMAPRSSAVPPSPEKPSPEKNSVARSKPPARDKAETKTAVRPQPQQAAVPWPFSLFSN